MGGLCPSLCSREYDCIPCFRTARFRFVFSHDDGVDKTAGEIDAGAGKGLVGGHFGRGGRDETLLYCLACPFQKYSSHACKQACKCQ